MELYQMYHPITATPFKRDRTYREYEPCDALKPYIRCFWGTDKPIIQDSALQTENSVVIPDTCMDIFLLIIRKIKFIVDSVG